MHAIAPHKTKSVLKFDAAQIRLVDWQWQGISLWPCVNEPAGPGTYEHDDSSLARSSHISVVSVNQPCIEWVSSFFRKKEIIDEIHLAWMRKPLPSVVKRRCSIDCDLKRNQSVNIQLWNPVRSHFLQTTHVWFDCPPISSVHVFWRLIYWLTRQHTCTDKPLFSTNLFSLLDVVRSIFCLRNRQSVGQMGLPLHSNVTKWSEICKSNWFDFVSIWNPGRAIQI
jgi:hypothetical protein